MFASKTTVYTLLVLSCFFTLYLYQPFGLYFLNDDFIHIPLSEKGIYFQTHLVRPVHEFLLHLEFLLFGKNPTGYHFTALLIHLSCTFLFYKLSKLLLFRYGGFEKVQAKTGAVLVASLFLIYAFHSEAILWILGKAASLCVAFFLTSIIYFIKKNEHKYNLVISILCFQVGLFTYESIWISPLIILLITLMEIRINKDNKRKEIIALLFYWSSFVLFLGIRYFIVGRMMDSYETHYLSEFNFRELFLNYNRLIARSFLPPMDSTQLFVLYYSIIIIVVAIMAIVLMRRFKQNLLFIFLSFCFLISLMPYISLGIDTHDTESERFLYLPSVFWCLTVGYLFLKGNVNNTLKLSCFILLMLFHCYYTYSNSYDYRMASEISKSSLVDVNNYSKVNSAVCVKNISKQFNGVKIFEMGFKEGLHWIYQTDTSKLVLSNFIEIFPINKSISFFELSQKFRFVPTKDPLPEVKCTELEFVYNYKLFGESK
ncbi:MAG: hypothetical protein EPO57_06030 [Chitinophagaceae bacterium]|nr:MAG: hypothetical protein EPO57_06030 [Chitinophagaceae bacterium]